VGRPPLSAVCLALVEVDLRARPARAGVAHHPEVVLAHPLDPLRGHPHTVEPHLGALVVALVHGDPETVGVEPHHLGEQLPGQGDRPVLEVVAEAEVPEHLEKRQVSPRDTDVGDVVVLAPDAHAFLHRGGPRGGRRLLAQDVGQELVHACVGEQRGGRVMGNEARRWDRDMTPVGEEGGEGAAKLVGSHGRGPAYRAGPSLRGRTGQGAG